MKKLPPGTDPLERVLLRTELDDFGCWVFGGAVHSAGYGVLNVRGKVRFAHRISYEGMVAPLGDLHVDHLCRDRLCVRPDHLSAVTNLENAEAGWRAREGADWTRKVYVPKPKSPRPLRSHCIRGHEFSEENVYWRPDGRGRQCRACISIRGMRQPHRRQE